MCGIVGYVGSRDARGIVIDALEAQYESEIPSQAIGDGVMQRLRDAGIGLAVVSNWDTSLEGAMLAVGLRGSFDVVGKNGRLGK